MKFLAALATASALHLRAKTHTQQEKLTTALIENVKYGNCITDDGDEVFVTECNYEKGSAGRVAQKWHFIAGPDSTVTLEAGTGANPKCLVRGDDDLVTLGSCDNALVFEWTGPDMVEFKTTDGDCLDPIEKSGATQIGFWECKGKENQQWIIDDSYGS